MSSTPPAALRSLLAGAIDYAGLFPPASLDMKHAAANYADYRRSPDAWALGRFVVPAARLEELAPVLPSLPSSDSSGAWSISALVVGSEQELGTIRRFNDDMACRAVVDCVEGKVTAADGVERLRVFAATGLETFIEVASNATLRDCMEAAAAIGAQVKIRTGGTTPNAFPSGADALRFMRVCRLAGVSFKATAGLHHPLRAEYRLTYEPSSPRGEMFGFLNILLAAVLVWLREDDEEVRAMLDERSAAAIQFDDSGVQWRLRALTTDVIEAARARFIRSFGSCSFREPLDELAEAGMW